MAEVVSEITNNQDSMKEQLIRIEVELGNNQNIQETTKSEMKAADISAKQSGNS